MSSRVLVAVPLALLSFLSSSPTRADSALALSGTNLLSFSTNTPQTIASTVAITNITAGETLVGIDVRPQNGQVYGLGVNPTTNTATLYAISPRTGFAGVVGTPGAVALFDGAGTPIDLPDPAVIGYGFDFNPLADRARVVAGSLNFRIDPNTGAAVDGNFGSMIVSNFVNPDGSINGGTTTVSATAYTNDRPNTPATTQYTLDESSNMLFIQNPPNGGTQTLGLVLQNGGTVDFTAINGFDIPAYISAPASNSPATGSGFAVLNVGGNTGLHAIDLTTAQTTPMGSLGNGTVATQGLALRQALTGIPMIGLAQAGTSLVRFNAATPLTTTTAPITGVTAGEVLVGIDFRPQTGQLYGLGVNAVMEQATVYRIDPQGIGGTAPASAIGSPGQVAFVGADGVTPVDLPDPSVSEYGFDFNPTVDRIRVTTSTGLNFRLNPNNGAAVDGNLNNTMVPPAGTNTDAPISGLPLGSTGIGANAYTNSYVQSLTGGVTTLYTLDAASNSLFIQNPANAGVQTMQRTVTLAGSPLDFTEGGGFDIPSDVVVATSGVPALGMGYAALIVGGSMQLYSIDLANGNARLLGNTAVPLRGLTVGESPDTLVFRHGFE